MTTEKTKTQVSKILKNMKTYAKNNNCSFMRDDFASHTYICFVEHNLKIAVLIRWHTDYLCVIDSESEDAFEELSFEEFVKWQREFLTR